MMDIRKFNKTAAGSKEANTRFLQRLKKNPPGNLDQKFHEHHDEVFGQINCLECANCCKTTGPLFTQKDIERLAAHFRMKPSAFLSTYLHLDEDGDYVLNVLPCPFLGSDNYCSVYEQRPNACREYPHTNQRKMHTILRETLNNSMICPAVFEILERMKKDTGLK